MKHHKKRPAALLDPSGQIAAIASVEPSPSKEGLPSLVPIAAPGTLDSLFNDGTDLPAYPLYRGLYIGVAGTLKFNDLDGNTVGPINVPQGVLPFRVRRIWSTGTTASEILGLR